MKVCEGTVGTTSICLPGCACQMCTDLGRHLAFRRPNPTSFCFTAPTALPTEQVMSSESSKSATPVTKVCRACCWPLLLRNTCLSGKVVSGTISVGQKVGRWFSQEVVATWQGPTAHQEFRKPSLPQVPRLS